MVVSPLGDSPMGYMELDIAFDKRFEGDESSDISEDCNMSEEEAQEILHNNPRMTPAKKNLLHKQIHMIHSPKQLPLEQYVRYNSVKISENINPEIHIDEEGTLYKPSTH